MLQVVLGLSYKVPKGGGWFKGGGYKGKGIKGITRLPTPFEDILT